MTTKLREIREDLNISKEGLLTSLGDNKLLISVKKYSEIEDGKRLSTLDECDIIVACVNVNRSEQSKAPVTAKELGI